MSIQRQQRVVFLTLLVGYGAFYLCRANFDAALPLLVQAGYSKTRLGNVASASVACYAFGKVALGVAGDAIGGKRIMLVALFGSVLATLGAGMSQGILALTAFVMINRLFQAGGWVGLVHVISRWFPPGRHGAVMGAMSTSYELGNVGALLFCGLLANTGLGWRPLFLVNPLVLALVGVLLATVLHATPKAALDAGTRGAAPKRAALGAASHEPGPRGALRENETASVPGPSASDSASDSGDDRVPLREVFPWLAKKPAFWATVALSMLVTFIRTGFLTWTPTYLYEVASASHGGSTISGSIVKSAIFPATGVVAALVIGRLSDRFGPGRRAPVVTVSLAFHVLAVLLLAHARLRDPIAATCAIGLCGLSVLGPYSLVAGALTLDVAGKRAASTAAGIIDGAGYAGATLVGVVIGRVADRWGWAAAFDVIAGAAGAATLLAGGWWFFSRNAPQRAEIVHAQLLGRDDFARQLREPRVVGKK